MSDQQSFSEDEAMEILRLAAQKSASAGQMNREQLESIAAEAGIAPAAIDQVLQERMSRTANLSSNPTKDLRPEFVQELHDELRQEVAGKLGVAVLCVGIDVATSHQLTWSIIVGGIMLAIALKNLVEFAIARPDRSELAYREWLDERATRQAPPEIVAELDQMGAEFVRREPLQAIKRLRERNDLSLKEAKQYVDDYRLSTRA